MDGCSVELFAEMAEKQIGLEDLARTELKLLYMGRG